MRIRVTWPDGRELCATVCTWQELHRVVGTDTGKRRDVSVVAEGDAFHIIVHG